MENHIQGRFEYSVKVHRPLERKVVNRVCIYGWAMKMLPNVDHKAS